MASQPPTPPPDLERATGWLSAVKGLTVTNAIVIILLVVAIAPAYVVYRALDDPALLDRFLSSYHVVSSQLSDCTLRTGRQRGEPAVWSISTGFAYEGPSRWVISVLLEREPTMEEQISYCATLEAIVDHMHGGGENLPEGLIWQYADPGSAPNDR
jgi:hypothetical protein